MNMNDTQSSSYVFAVQRSAFLAGFPYFHLILNGRLRVIKQIARHSLSGSGRARRRSLIGLRRALQFCRSQVSKAPFGKDGSMTGFKFPTAYTILFVLIAVVAALTWVIPAGEYAREMNEALGAEAPCPAPIMRSKPTLKASPR
jgi:hypothetical protein